eukprot:gnl/MRDRNA2_/MRDRNA2_77054_c0_seq1.p1 gnl/MRDRNA2_/MRDRNA2_77054_c0~~gnl/MRDRNA2_/MRDRNA2_77054_c0_seq1.p1  ORF type:complete len:840 (-),score=211.07 gnl/MRDRNA2_/MRDRNA2_77054_c0_seq1:54-2573(-)
MHHLGHLGGQKEQWLTTKDGQHSARAPEFVAPAVLEVWLGNAAAGADPAAKMLQNLLRINPAYGPLLFNEPDLAETVQLSARTIRTLCSSANPPGNVQLEKLWEPLCGVAWRAIGHVMDSLLGVEHDHGLTWPLPHETHGQLRALLHTNGELSKQLSECRRNHLKEVTELRDQVRKLSPDAKEALKVLYEEPIMFYEPLDFVLDEGTKAFVNEVCEERIKLALSRYMKLNAKEQDSQAQEYLEDLQFQLKEQKERARRLELDRSKQASNSAQDSETIHMQLEEHEQRELELYQELEASREAAELRLEEEEECRHKAEQMNRRLGHLEKHAGKSSELEQRLEAEAARQMALNAANEELSAERRGLMDKMESLQASLALHDSDTDASSKLRTETEELREQLAQCEQQLAASTEGLQHSLSQLEGNQRDLILQKLAGKFKVAGLQHALKAMEERSSKDKLEMEVLQRQKQATTVVRELVPEPKPKSDPEAGLVTHICERCGEYEVKCEAFESLQTEHNELKERYDELSKKLAILVDKLHSKLDEDEVGEVLHSVDLHVKIKKKKKPVHARLYEDAQRRVRLMRANRKQMEREQKEAEAVFHIAKATNSKHAVRQAEMVSHLQKTSAASAARFHVALQTFHETHAPQIEQQMALASSPRTPSRSPRESRLSTAPSQSGIPSTVPSSAPLQTRDGNRIETEQASKGAQGRQLAPAMTSYSSGFNLPHGVHGVGVDAFGFGMPMQDPMQKHRMVIPSGRERSHLKISANAQSLPNLHRRPDHTRGMCNASFEPSHMHAKLQGNRRMLSPTLPHQKNLSDEGLFIAPIMSFTADHGFHDFHQQGFR